MAERSDADLEFENIGDAREVEPVRERGQGLRLGVALVAAGLVIGAIVAAGTTIVGGFAQTEAGLCRITWAACTELSLNSVEVLSGLDFPDGTEVVSGFSRESVRAPEFRAEVVLPEGAPFSLATEYYELDVPEPRLIPAVGGRNLGPVRYWSPFVPVSGSTSVAVQGVDDSGKTVILFDTHGRG